MQFALFCTLARRKFGLCLDGNGIAATLAVDQQVVSQLLVDVVQVGEINGVKFPREFGLLLKQILYFDRYVRLLAPEIEVVSDERVAFMDSAALQSKDRTMT